MKISKKWLAVTVNLGDPKYQFAEERLVKQSQLFSSEFDLLVVNRSNFSNFAPQAMALYPKLLNSEVRGYGYWVWKAEICKTVLNTCQDLGYKGVLYLDIGCELFQSKFSKLMLRGLFRIASRRQALVFSSGGTDLQYTKAYVLKKMNVAEKDIYSSQFAATWFMFTPEKSMSLIAEWSDLSLSDIKLSDFSECEKEKNSLEFVEHRSDQSIFSLLCKSRRVHGLNFLDYSGRNMSLHRFRRHFYPIWTSRNLSSQELDSIRENY